MIRLALLAALVIYPALQVLSAVQSIPQATQQCATDTECMQMHGGDGGPDTGE